MKDKIIEEMATEIARIVLSCPLNQGRNCGCCEFNDKDTISYDCQSYLVAEKLLEKYQPKIPENAVVLTEEELFTRDEKIHKADREYIKSLEECINNRNAKVRKETVDKFVERLKEKARPTYVNIDDNPRKDSFIFLSDIDEIAKKITEGKECQNK